MELTLGNHKDGTLFTAKVYRQWLLWHWTIKTENCLIGGGWSIRYRTAYRRAMNILSYAVRV